MREADPILDRVSAHDFERQNGRPFGRLIDWAGLASRGSGWADWTQAAERARIAAESFRPGVSVSEVARRYGATRSQVYDWRRRLKDGRLALAGGVAAMPAFAEVVVTPAVVADAGLPRPAAIEIDIAGSIIRVPAGVEADALSHVIRAVRKASAE